MIRYLCWLVLSVALVGNALGAEDDPLAQNEAAEATEVSPEEQAIRQAVAAFVKAFNAHDAKALADRFTEDASVVGVEGDAITGRDAIVEEFAALFEDSPDVMIDLQITSIRLVGPGTAIEEGTATLAVPGAEEAEVTRYVVTHVQRDGRWLQASIREFPIDESSSPQDHLKQLEWLVGEWVDEGDDSVVLTTFAWSENQAFLLGDFTVEIAGQPALTGTQRIGWDPSTKQIKSWVFDSEGGFGEGYWTRAGDLWIVKLSGVLRDGTTASATRHLTQISTDRTRVEILDRIVSGQLVPDVEFLMVRKPPEPR